jgi:hypothetical protein
VGNWFPWAGQRLQGASFVNKEWALQQGEDRRIGRATFIITAFIFTMYRIPGSFLDLKAKVRAF